MPTGAGWTIIDRAVREALSVTNAAGYYCASNDIVLTAHITPANAPGSITFYLWTDNTHSTSHGSSTIDGSGNASVTIPGGTLPNGTYYIQATYPGSGSYAPASTPSGTSGTQLLATTSIPTITTITPQFSQPICPYVNAPFTVTVTASGGGAPPTSGTIQIWIEGDGPFYEASITGGALSGSNSTTATITGIAGSPCANEYQWFSTGTNTIYAAYLGDGSCYAGSQSTNTSIDVEYTTTVAMSVPQQDSNSNPVGFCKNDGGSNTWKTTLTLTGGSTATGQITWYTTQGGTIIATTSGTFSSGVPVTQSIAHSAFPLGTGQSVFAQFCPTTTTGCVGFGNTGSTASFDVVNSTTQAPPITLDVSTDDSSWASSVSTEYNTSTIYCRVIVNKTGMIGTDSSTISLYAGTINGGPYSSNITASATYFPSGPPVFTDSGSNFTTLVFSFSCDYFGNVNQTFYMIATYNGNSCFGSSNSSQVTINQSQYAG